VLKWGTGGINIDGCRVEFSSESEKAKHAAEWDRNWSTSPIHAFDAATGNHPGAKREIGEGPKPQQGRFPANLIHDGSQEVLDLFPESKPNESAARFFYCAKASKKDRDEGNNHATVKPTALMRYLCRLITPAGGTVLDPYMGSGSTGKAAMLEGFSFVGCEIDDNYFDIARSRIENATAL
jgi:DNA modification methylase